MSPLLSVLIFHFLSTCRTYLVFNYWRIILCELIYFLIPSIPLIFSFFLRRPLEKSIVCCLSPCNWAYCWMGCPGGHYLFTMDVLPLVIAVSLFFCQIVFFNVCFVVIWHTIISPFISIGESIWVSLLNSSILAFKT